MLIADQIDATDEPVLRGSSSRRYGCFWNPGERSGIPLTELQPPLDATPELLRHEARLEKAGYKASVIASRLSAARGFIRYLENRKLRLEDIALRDIADFQRMRLEAFEERYGCLPKNPSAWRNGCVGPIHQFLRMAHPHWPPEIPPSDTREEFHREILDGYSRWLTERYGFSKGTAVKNGRAARMFLLWWKGSAGREELHQLRITDIDEYLAVRLPQLRRASRYGVCLGLRSFVRYLHAVELIPKDFSADITGPILYRCDEIPRAFTETNIRAMLRVTRRDRTAKGLRDYAILLMLATYGLRGGEVVGLRLEDIEWRSERLRVRQSKIRGEYFLPLAPSVGEALLNYLKHGRPGTQDRHVFLRVRAPVVPFSSVSALAGIILARMKKAGVKVEGRHGAHAFRFARAMSLLRAAVPIKFIGDLLGHRTASSTEIYLRLGTNDLRSISLEVPGEDSDVTLAGQGPIAVDSVHAPTRSGAQETELSPLRTPSIWAFRQRKRRVE